MSIRTFFEENIIVVTDEILREVNNVFTSHEFIQKFSKKFEREYIGFLHEHLGEGAFRQVHSEIARALSANEGKLNIEKTRRVLSKHIFGEEDEIQEWKKI